MIKKYIDHHTHTQASPDADQNLTMEIYVQKAIELGYPGVMFTDHAEYDFIAPLFDKKIDYSVYYNQIVDLRLKYKFPIFMGIEIGYQPHLVEKLDSIVKSHLFDFVILSVHMGDKKDFYNGDFFSGKTQSEGYQRYFEIVLEAIETVDNFDVFGHIDYITRCGNYENKSYDFEYHKPILTKILKTLIAKNKGIELNTSGLRHGVGTMYPRIELLKLYKQLGGNILTLGSDAHHLKDYQKDFDLAISIIQEAGFSSITHFSQRQSYYINF
jgi:histidinol-phosphatase (PHP family)